MTEPVTIGHGANKWIVDSDTRAVTLMSDFATTTNGDISMTEAKNKQSGSEASNSRYVVPVGKKFIILLIEPAGYDLNRLAYSTTINDGTNANENGTNIFWKMGKNTDNPNTHTHEVYIEIPAGNYIHTVYAETSGASAYAINVYGVETSV